jgi:hypothetical protein
MYQSTTVLEISIDFNKFLGLPEGFPVTRSANNRLQQVSSKINTSAPKTGQTMRPATYRAPSFSSLLIPVEPLCSGRYKIDYIGNAPIDFQ